MREMIERVISNHFCEFQYDLGLDLIIFATCIYLIHIMNSWNKLMWYKISLKIQNLITSVFFLIFLSFF